MIVNTGAQVPVGVAAFSAILFAISGCASPAATASDPLRVAVTFDGGTDAPMVASRPPPVPAVSTAKATTTAAAKLPPCSGSEQRYSPFEQSGDDLLGAAKAQAAVEVVRSEWAAVHGPMGDCRVVANDGHLLIVSCDSYYETRGGLRAGDGQHVIFRRLPDEGLERLSLKTLLPDPTFKLTLDLCVLREVPAAIPAHGGLLVFQGYGGTNQAICLLPYEKIRQLLGCGPLAVHTGRKQLLPPKTAGDPLPLAVSRAMDLATDQRLVYVHVQSVDNRPTARAAAAAVNQALADLFAGYQRQSGSVHVTCDVALSTDALIGIHCQGNAGENVNDGITFRLGRSPQPIFTAEILAKSHPNALQTITTECLKGLQRPSKGEHDYVLARVPKWTADTLRFALLDADRSWFFGEIETKNSAGQTRQDTASCIVSHQRLGLNLERLAEP